MSGLSRIAASARSARLTERLSGALRLSRAWLWAHRLDVVALVLITGLAAALRVYHLDTIPAGMHVDEANTAIRANVILDGGFAGPYDIYHGHGQPAGTEFWTAAVILLFGDGLFALRLSIALWGIAAVALAYVFFRMVGGRPTAVIGATLLALSSWDIYFSRTAWPPIATTSMELGAAIALLLTLRGNRWWLFPLTGVFLALGIYVYNGYLYFLPAVALVLAGWVISQPGQFRAAVGKVLSLSAAFLITSMPMILFVRSNRDVYIGRGRNESIFSSERYDQASGFVERADVVLDSGREFVKFVVFQPVIDTPMLAPAVSVLLGLGILYAAGRWRQPGIALAVLSVLIIPWAAILNPGNVTDLTRRAMGVTPFVYLLAALPLAALLRSRRPARPALQAVGLVFAAAAIVSTGFINMKFYFDEFANAYTTRILLSQPLQAASTYMDELPDDYYVYFYARRWDFQAPVRIYLAPDAQGETRSAAWPDIVPDRNRNVAYVFIDTFVALAPEVERLYPGGEAVEERDGEDILFRAYALPKERGPLPP